MNFLISSNKAEEMLTILNGLLSNDQPMDPYLLWAIRTQFRQFRAADSMDSVVLSFLVELKDPFDPKVWRKNFVGIDVAPVYASPLANSRCARFVTARFTYHDDTVVGLLQKLLTNPAIVLRVQVGHPRGVRPREKLSVETPPTLRDAHVVIGVVDDGCAFAHAQLACPSGTRLAAYWNQSTTVKYTSGSPQWRKASQFAYGAVMYQKNMDAHISANTVGDEEDDTALYQALFQERLRSQLSRESHGATVTMLAAGNRLTDGSMATDAASKAPIIFVDLPREQVEISSGRWLPVNGLDAFRFIVEESRRIVPRDLDKGQCPVPVAINLSSGSGAGPHDGSAMFERAMDELLDADDRVAIILAAGNARLSDTHYVGSASSQNPATIEVLVPELKNFETMVELWFDHPDGKPLGDKIEIKLFSPTGGLVAMCLPNSASFVPSWPAPVESGLVFLNNAVQSNNKRSMALVAIAATAVSNEYPYAFSGVWTIVVNNDSDAAIEVNAWIERDEIVFGTRRPQSARFVEATEYEPAPFWRTPLSAGVQRSGTLSNIAGGFKTFAAAACIGNQGNTYVSPYSAEPIRAKAGQSPDFPLFVATADATPARSGILSNGNRASVRRHINGTSAAAPQSTRWVANEMATGKTRQQIRADVLAQPLRDHPFLLLDNGGVSGSMTKAASDGRQVVAYQSWAERTSA